MSNSSLVEQHLSSPESAPRHIAEVAPKMTVDNTVINLSLHTDNLGRLMRLWLNPNHASSQVQIKVRLLTPEVWEKIQRDPLFKLFLEGRYEKVKYLNDAQQEVVEKGFVTPRNTHFTAAELRDYLSQGQKPETLAQAGRFDYPVGFILVEELRRVYLDKMANGLMPFLGGCTAFDIGSDTLTHEQLLELAQKLSLGLSEGDLSLISLSTGPSDPENNILPKPMDLNVVQKSGCEFHPLSTLK